MESHSYTSFLEGTYYSVPLIIIVILWSEMSTRIINTDDLKIARKAAFKRDLFLITFGFLVAFTFPLIFEYNNSDVVGWWPLIILIGFLYGLFYALVFSLISLIVGHHKKQTIFFMVLIVMLISIENLIPQNISQRYISIFLFGEVESFHVIMDFFLFIYLFLYLGQRVLMWRRLNKFND